MSGVLLSIFLFSCNGKSSSDLNANVARFVSSSDQIVGYGYVNLLAIKGKSQLSQVPTVGEFIDKQMSSFEESLKLTDKIHYAFEGPLDRNGEPKLSYIFLTVENEDSIQKMFEGMSFKFDKEKGIQVANGMNMVVGFDESTAAIIIGNLGDSPNEKIHATFDTFKSEQKNEDVTEILATTTDILIAADLEAIFEMSQSQIQSVNAEKKEELEELFEDGHAFLSLDFNNGDLTAKFDFSRVSDKMKENSFFMDEVSDDILENLGAGEPLMAIAMSFDVEKMDEYWKEYKTQYEDLLNIGYRQMGGLFMALAEDNISNVMNGDVGMALFQKEQEEKTRGDRVISNLYVGLGENPQNLKDLINSYAEGKVIESMEDGFYRKDESMILINDEALIIRSNDTLKSSFDEDQELVVTERMEDFGDTPFAMFVDLAKMAETDVKRFAGREFQSLISIADYLSVKADNETVVIKLAVKNKDENILKQIVDVYENDLQNQIGNISFN